MKNDTTYGYFPVNDKAIAAGFYLTGAGVEHIKPNQPYPLPSHPDMYQFSWNTGRVLPEYQLVFVFEGAGEFESRATGRIRLQAGSAILLSPDFWHRYRPKKKSGWADYWISYNGAIPHFWQEAGLMNPAHAVRKLNRPERVKASLEKIVDSAVKHHGLSRYEPPAIASLSGITVLAEILAETIAASVGSPAASLLEVPSYFPAETIDERIKGALEIIWNHSHRDLSVASIAQELDITPRTLERRFRAALGRTVQEELTACRLARAQMMLSSTHLPIKRIAYAAGFSSATHLAVVFQRERGMTPSQVRQSARHATAG